MTSKIYHNEVVEQLREWVRNDKENFPTGETYTTFEDVPDLRDRIKKGKVPIDLRYSIDLIHVEKKEEERDERDKSPEKGEAKVVYYYTLFLVTTGGISGEGASEISGISDSLRKRLLFYQYYFSSISEPKYIRVILVIPSDVDVSPDAMSKLFEEYKIGLWKVDVKNKIKCEEVQAEFVLSISEMGHF